MRIFWKALHLIAMVLLVSRGATCGDQYVPPPFPEDLPPFPGDPPDLFDDPFNPINDVPDPWDIPWPPEDDDIPLPDPWDIPDPPDLDDPFPDLPSLLPDPFEDIPDSSMPSSPPSPGAGPQMRALTATSLVTKLMPFPMRIPFHPSYSGKNAPLTKPPCNPAGLLIIPGTRKNNVGFFSTCPPGRTATVPVGVRPAKVAPAPDGMRALVANEGDGNTSGTVSVINIASRAVSQTITLPAADANGNPVQPNNIAFLPDGSRAYVTSHSCTPGLGSFVYIIDMSSLTVAGSIKVGCVPTGIAVTPDGSQIWVSIHFDNRVEIIDAATNADVAAFSVASANGIAFNPTGTKAYVAEGGSPGNVVVIDTSTYSVLTRIPVGNLPHVVRVSPSGHHLFVTNALSNNISWISTSTNTVVKTVPLLGGAKHPLGLAFFH